MAMSNAGWPGVKIGTDFVSVSYARTKPGCFEWRISCQTGEVWGGITPPTPSRYMNGASLDDALVAVLYCLMQSVHSNPPIQNLMHFPFAVTRWAVVNHAAIRAALSERMEWDTERGTPVTLFVNK